MSESPIQHKTLNILRTLMGHTLYDDMGDPDLDDLTNILVTYYRGVLTFVVLWP